MSDDPQTPAADDPSGDEPTTDGGAALRRAEQSIREAEDAEGAVAAKDDITTLDDERAGEFSEDPDGSGGT